MRGGPHQPAALASVRTPGLRFRGRTWTSEDVAAAAREWRRHVEGRLGAEVPGLVATVLGNHPETIPAFFALAGLPWPILILPPDTRAWRSVPAIPGTTPIALAPAFHSLAEEARARKLRPLLLPALTRSGEIEGGTVVPLVSPGVLALTSGSTSTPKPAFRRTAAILDEARAIVAANGLPRGSGVVASVPLAFAGFFGFTHVLMVASVLEGPIGLTGRFEHRQVLELFAAREYAYWPATPKLAEVLTQCPLREPWPAPATCVVTAGALPAKLAEAFLRRFGVPLRPSYGMTEAGVATMSAGPPSTVRPESVGRPLPGVRIRVGDDPLEPWPADRPGRVWLATPWAMDGYGFPPALDPPPGRDGWIRTSDMGVVDHDGVVTLLGRADVCFKTDAGYLVNPAEIARVLTSCPGVQDAVVLPVEVSGQRTVAALVEGADVDADEVRRHAAARLPAWAQIATVVVTPEVPRLPGGKVDRQACIAILNRPREDASRTGGHVR